MIQIDIPLPKTCRDCPLSQINEDMYGDYYYYCQLIEKCITGKAKDRRDRKCPLKEVKENEQCPYFDYEVGTCRRSEQEGGQNDRI